MKPLILFDFDGTLADSVDLLIDVANDIAVEKGYNPTFSREAFHKQSFEELVKRMGISLFKVSNFVKEGKQAFTERLSSVSMHNHIDELLEMASSYAHLAIITSNTPEVVRQVLAKNVQEYFAEIIHGGLFTKSKSIKKLRKQFGLKKNQVLYVGDESRDMHAARRAGVESMAVTWGVQGEESLLKTRPTMLAKTATEAQHLLKAWIVSR
jgi:phosphoglycolate phosphatase-like HAD superfamily hydrolase